MCAQSAISSTVVTVGNFDGVHCGHQALVTEARRMAGADGQVIALVFDPHPRFILSPDLGHPAKLSTFPSRRQLLLQYGANVVHQLTPTPDLLNQSPSEFVEMLVAEYGMSAMMEGPDFRFGRKRSGDMTVLRELGEQMGFEVRIADAVELGLSDQMMVKASSSMARRMIRVGRIRDTAKILGRPYRLIGEVVQGDGRGRTIGYPTANVRTEYLIPASGVYECRARRRSVDHTEGDEVGEWYAAAVNIGTRPTFKGGVEQVCEVYLLDFAGEVGLYGWDIEVEFRTFLRDEIQFPSVEAVIAQIGRDVNRVRTLATY